MVERYLRVIVVGVIVLCAGDNLCAEDIYENWVRYYNGQGNGDDRPRAMVVDDSGYIYVTGSTWDGNTFDYLTIKYAPNGDILWTRVYEGEDDGHDVSTDIILDPQGRAIVTGYSWDDSSLYDYVTIKYDRNGNVIWNERYDGPAKKWDEGRTLCADSYGNIYVTGRSYATEDGPYGYTTIKYSPDGIRLWVENIKPGFESNIPTAISVDGSGNVYVTGVVGGGAMYTVKYSSSGSVNWTKYFYGADGTRGYNLPSAVAIDRSGNIYVAGAVSMMDWNLGMWGYGYGTIKYSPSGDELWVRTYSGSVFIHDHVYGVSALAIDMNGNVFVTGWSRSWSGLDYATIKYSPNGESLWVRRYNGYANLDDGANALVVDKIGNVYVTGWSYDSTTSQDYVTIKYDSNGNLFWESRFNGPSDMDDQACDISLDVRGNIYVTGWSTGTGTAFDYTTIRYSSCLGITGDLNSDDRRTIVDVVYLVNIVFKSWPIPKNVCLANVNGDSKVSIADAIYLANHVFKFGPAPVKAGHCCD